MCEMWKRITRWAFLSVGAAVLAAACATGPGARPQPEPAKKPAPPPPAPGFVMKPFHRSMSEGMRKSYALADEIIIGEFTGTHQDDKGDLTCYFTDFSRFDKESLSWSPPQEVIMPVLPGKADPEIIRKNEFNTLIDLDKVGICWDAYEGRRSIYLVEGKKNLLFLEFGFDEVGGISYRNLLDAYPVTKECRAADVFNHMVRNLVTRRPR